MRRKQERGPEGRQSVDMREWERAVGGSRAEEQYWSVDDVSLNVGPGHSLQMEAYWHDDMKWIRGQRAGVPPVPPAPEDWRASL